MGYPRWPGDPPPPAFAPAIDDAALSVLGGGPASRRTPVQDASERPSRTWGALRCWLAGERSPTPTSCTSMAPLAPASSTETCHLISLPVCCDRAFRSTPQVPDGLCSLCH